MKSNACPEASGRIKHSRRRSASSSEVAAPPQLGRPLPNDAVTVVDGRQGKVGLFGYYVKGWRAISAGPSIKARRSASLKRLAAGV